MKFAVCLIGHVRSFESLSNQWNECKKLHSPTFFFHTWSDKTSKMLLPKLLTFDPEMVVENQDDDSFKGFVLGSFLRRARLSVLKRVEKSDCEAVMFARFDVKLELDFKKLEKLVQQNENVMHVSFIRSLTHDKNAYSDIVSLFSTKHIRKLIYEWEMFNPSLYHAKRRIEDGFEQVCSKNFTIKQYFQLGKQFDILRENGRFDSEKYNIPMWVILLSVILVIIILQKYVVTRYWKK